ncbi:MAG: hypothetical protein AB1Z19_05750 [Eubacteriales bacterium]
MRKPYEYDYNKKERRAWLTGIGIVLLIALLGLGYYIWLYEPPKEIFVAPTTDENPSWVLEDFTQPLDAPITNTKDERSAINYYNVLAEFRVETALRYQPQSGKTFCNIYAWDVANAMDVHLPHYLTKDLMLADEDAYYYTASSNVYACFLEVRGLEYGWKVVTAKEAQERANEGYMTIGVWRNPNAAVDENDVCAHYPSGHIVLVRPQPTGSVYRSSKGPYIAQAGAFNTMNANVSDIFNVFRKIQIVYYTHD